MQTLATASQSRPHALAPNRGGRCSAIDVLKAVAIVAVVWIHAYERWPLPHVKLLWGMMVLTRFAVPAFFFTSGFLYFSPAPISGALVFRRLRRLLAPYLVASAVAVGGRWVLVAPVPFGQIAYELLTGSAVSVFYFVPVLASTLVFLPVLSRRQRLALPMLAVFLVAGLLTEMLLPAFHIRLLSSGRDPLFWELRSPLRWWGYFLTGWVVASYFPLIRRLSRTVDRTVAIVALLLLGGLFAYYMIALPQRSTLLGGAILYAAIYCTIGGVFFVALGSVERAAIRWLSEATYPIYLYHVFFIWGYHYLLPQMADRIDGLAFLTGLSGSIAVLVGGRRLLGRHARLLLG